MSELEFQFFHAQPSSRITPQAKPKLVNHASRRGFLCLVVATTLACSAMRGLAEEEILVGHTAAGKLKAQVGFSVLGLEVSVFAGITGYATGEVGFHSAAF